MTHASMQLPVLPADLKLTNRFQVISPFLSGQAHSATEISEEIGLSRQTVMKSIQFFLNKGILSSAGKGVSTNVGGKRPELFNLSKDRFFLCITLWPQEARLSLYTIGGKLLDKRAVFRKRRGHQDGLIIFAHKDAEFSGLRFCKAAEIQLRANVLRQRENQLLCGRGFLQGPGKNRLQQLPVSAFPHIGCRTRQCARDRLRAFADPLVDGAPQMLHLYVAIWQIERRFDGKTECCVTGISPAAAELHDG